MADDEMRLTVSIFEIRQALNEVGLGALPDKFELEQPSFRLLIDVAVIRMVNKNLHAIIGLFFWDSTTVQEEFFCCPEY